MNSLVADISSNNSTFNAHAYRAGGHILVAIKATEGRVYVNPEHRSWSLAAGLEHIAVVHYHFGRPDLGNDPAAEADHFLEAALPLAGGRDYLVLDLERATPQGWSHDPSWSVRFDERVQQRSRFHCILYSSRGTLQAQPDAEWLHGENKRVWDADWSSGPDWGPKGYAVAMRQFTDGVLGPEPHGLVGVGQCDVSAMRGKFFEAVLAKARR